MKIAVTGETITTIKIDDALAPHNMLWGLLGSIGKTARLEMLKALVSQHPDFDIAAAVTTPVVEHEFVVLCVTNNHPDILDWVLDNKIIHPDYIAKNGSPLALFAMQKSEGIFKDLVVRGARIIRDGDLICNKTHTQITSFFCAGLTIQMILVNLVLANISKITNTLTLHKCVELGKGFHLPKTVLTKFTDRIIELTLAENKRKMASLITALRSGTGTSRDLLFGLVSAQCTVAEHYVVIAGHLPEADIKSAMYTSLLLTDNAVYTSICKAFPLISIQ